MSYRWVHDTRTRSQSKPEDAHEIGKEVGEIEKGLENMPQSVQNRRNINKDGFDEIIK